MSAYFHHIVFSQHVLCSSFNQEVSNRLAKRCVFACACLGGYRDDKGEEPVAPNNPAVRKSLRAMLTPFLARKLADPEPAEVSEFDPKHWSLGVSA